MFDRKTKQDRLPPLNALRAFEAAARLMSFAAAAKELHVTPAAISHQIKGLEEHLGVALFLRKTKGLELTRPGQVLRPRLSEGFEKLVLGVEELHALREPGTLAVSAATSFATRWLAPRLHRFVSAHPALDVRITASTRLIDPAKGEEGDTLEGSPVEDADIVVRFGSGDYEGFRVDRLFQVSVTPMCSPKLLAEGPPLAKPEDIVHHVLIHHNVRADDGGSLWNAWLRSAGARASVGTDHGLRFSHAMLALEAAADGLGVVMGLPQLAGSDLAAGRLVAPFAHRLPIQYGYYIVSGHDTADRSDVEAFRNWLQSEAERDR